MIARYFFDNDTSVVATLSGSVIQVTANRNSLTLTGTTSNYVANFMQAFTMGDNPITGPASLNIDGVGPISLRDNEGASLSSSTILADQRCLAVKDGANDYFRLIYPSRKADAGDILTTEGDVLFRDSSGLQRLAVGTAGQALVVNSGATAPEWGSAGRILQVVNSQSGAVATGTTTVPVDDTIPQSTEGNEFFTLAITPAATGNKLLIEATLVLALSVDATLVVALFQDSTADALAAVVDKAAGSNDNTTVTLRHYMDAGTTSATTFKIRAGSNTAGTVTLNGASGSRRMGGVMVSGITITEISA